MFKALVKIVNRKCILSDCALSVAMVNTLNPDFLFQFPL